MTKRILMMISIAIITTIVGCNQQSIEVVTTTKPSTTITNTSTTTTTMASTIATTEARTTTDTATSITKTTTKPTTSKPTTTRHTTTLPHTTTTTTKKVATESYCKGNNDHWVSCGNMGKWYNTRDDVKAEYSRVANIWNTKYRNGEIVWDTYIANCPQGYECWSCPGCGKWTGNYH